VSSFSFSVRDPVPKARARITRRGRFTPGKVKAFEKRVGAEALGDMAHRSIQAQAFDGPVNVQATFHLKTSSGDLDNYVKALLDGMNGLVFDDDTQVVHLVVAKRPIDGKTGPCVEVLVEASGSEFPWGVREKRKAVARA
jgi:Holliday junction resolvase RusA-like endonuclease